MMADFLTCTFRVRQWLQEVDIKVFNIFNKAEIVHGLIDGEIVETVLNQRDRDNNGDVSAEEKNSMNRRHSD